MKRILFALVMLLTFFACETQSEVTASPKKKRRKSTPVAIQRKIDSIKTQPPWNPPAQVNEYLYENRRVFLFSADCCDFFESVLDKNGNYICAPSGGITGKGDGKCPEFNKSAKHVKLVWKDGRVRK